MSAKRISAVAIAVLFGVTSFACLIVAEDDGVPLMITAPAGDDPISCAVFFADNMVYAPQWRLDNYVRIETMVLDMTDYASSREILRTDTDLYPEIYADGLVQQAEILADSEEVLPLTKMVSVSYIEVTVTSDVLDEPIMFAAGWDPVTGAKVIEVNGFGREVNKVGHLIYGTLWDTIGPRGGRVHDRGQARSRGGDTGRLRRSGPESSASGTVSTTPSVTSTTPRPRTRATC